MDSVIEYPIRNVFFSWNAYFNNHNPIEIELGCGDGSLAIHLAKMNPHINYIGVDIKGDRLYQAAMKAQNLNLKNIAFLRTQIQFVGNVFYSKMVHKIWLFYPDPHLGSKTKLRLTHPKFLSIYQNFCLPQCSIYFKTDSPELYEFTMSVLKESNYVIEFATDNLQNNPAFQPIAFFSTKFDKLNISNSKKKFYVHFRLN